MNSQQGMFGKLIRGSKWLMAIALALFVGQGLAGTVHVAIRGNDTTGDGTEGNPYRTIQKGIDMASTDDTVLVGEGDFADIGGAGGNIPTVAVINKKIILKGAGRGKTFITGAYGNEAGSDLGTGAHRGIYMAAAGTGAEVRDLTVRKGATTGGGTGWDVVNVSSVGGGIAAEAGDGNILYVYDCDILDCRAGEGGATAHDVRACRCRFAGNRAKGGQHVFCRNKYTYNCLFENNGPAAGSARAGWMFNYVTGFTMVNCTFVNNNVDRLLHARNSDAKMCLYNSFVIDTKPLDGGATTADYDLRNVVQNWPLGQASKIQSYAAYGCKWDVCKATQYFSPADDDWRSLPGNAIVGAGNADLVTTETTGIPAAELNTDYSGNPRFAGGKVSVGCFEPTEVIPAERIVGSFLLAGGATVTKDGRTLSGVPAVAGRWWGLEGCGQVRVGYTGSDELFGWTVASDRGILGGESYTVARFPDNNADRGFWLTPTKGGLATITAIPATDVKWVDDDADASVADGTEENPYVTVADAVAAIAERGLIKVKPGTYAAGTVTDGGKVCRVSLSKDVAIRSTDGAEKTVLKGGEGLDAIVLSTDATNARYAQVQGFTLTGCANDPSKDADQVTTGAAWLCGYYESGDNATARGYSEGVHLTDSVISNNVAIRACAGGWLERCLLIDNFTTVANMNTKTSGKRGTQAYAAILSGCVSYYSTQYFVKGKYPTVCTCAHQNCTDINCSFHVPDLDAIGEGYRTLNVPNGMTVAINTTMISPRFDNYTPAADRYAAGCVSSPGYDTAFTTAVPEGEFFTDSAAHDYHPLSGSVGLGYSVVTTNKYVRFETGDFNGKPLAYEANGGKPIPGAFQEVCSLRVSQDASRGTPSVTGNVYAQAGEEITVSATPASSDLRLRGWFVDGGFTESGVAPLAITVDLAKKPQSVLPVFARDLYVNANAADDTGDGLTPETAKKYLNSIAALAVYGDVIHAARGTYGEGTMTQTQTIYAKATSPDSSGTVPLGYSLSRVVLTNAVELVSDEGAGVTVIKGFWESGNSGKGPTSVRCVVAYAGASVRGFTLSGGATDGLTGAEYDENMGGIVLAPKATSRAATALFEDCVFSDGSARTGGCVAGGYLHRCKLARGYSGGGASLTQYAALDACVALGSSNTGVRNHYGVRSSVVINTGVGGEDLKAVNDAAVENSIIALKNANNPPPTVPGKETRKNLRNCIWNVGDGQAFLDDATCRNVITCTVDLASVDAALASLGLDASGRPAAGAPSIDKGDNALLAALADPLYDKGGIQRIYNAAVDIGAYEYVCTNEFTAAICGRRSQVTDASPMVALGDGEVLDIPADEELCIGWKSKRAGASAKLGVATLADGALLKVFVGDDLLTTISSSGTYELTADAPMMNLRLVAVGGAAEVSSFDPNREGLGVIIR